MSIQDQGTVFSITFQTDYLENKVRQKGTEKAIEELYVEGCEVFRNELIRIITMIDQHNRGHGITPLISNSAISPDVADIIKKIQEE